MLGKVGPASAGSSEDDAGGRRHTLLPWRLLTRELIMIGELIALASVSKSPSLGGGEKELRGNRTLCLRRKDVAPKGDPWRRALWLVAGDVLACDVCVRVLGGWVCHADGMPARC